MKRREFLARSATAVSASLLLGSIRSDGYRFVGSALAAGEGDWQKATLERKFAEFALSIKYEALPADVVASAKRVLLDALGCAFGSVGSEPADIAETTIRKTFGEGNTATVIGYPRSATVEGALFVNGVLVRSLDLNDTYIGTEPLHPSEVLPTAIALCEENGRSGRELIEAIVAGYEVSMRVNDAISFIERGFHPLCAASYGIPLIAGKIWGLPKEALANAVGISGARGKAFRDYEPWRTFLWHQGKLLAGPRRNNWPRQFDDTMVTGLHGIMDLAMPEISAIDDPPPVPQGALLGVPQRSCQISM
jgi:2-methylcitrate dehydratase